MSLMTLDEVLVRLRKAEAFYHNLRREWLRSRGKYTPEEYAECVHSEHDDVLSALREIVIVCNKIDTMEEDLLRLAKGTERERKLAKQSRLQRDAKFAMAKLGI